jgi:hypothetical protein
VVTACLALSRARGLAGRLAAAAPLDRLTHGDDDRVRDAHASQLGKLAGQRIGLSIADVDGHGASCR